MILNMPSHQQNKKSALASNHDATNLMNENAAVELKGG